MNSEDAVTACVLIIGNEILSGRTQDTNLNHIALTLGRWGIQVREARVIPDIEARIVEAVNYARSTYDYVFTTGGIGPTHDDITAGCIARAFDVPLVEHPEIAALIHRRQAPPDVMAARLRMAQVPAGFGSGRQYHRRPTWVLHRQRVRHGGDPRSHAGHARQPGG